jgi:hypothetical protein
MHTAIKPHASNNSKVKGTGRPDASGPFYFYLPVVAMVMIVVRAGMRMMVISGPVVRHHAAGKAGNKH